MAHRIGINAAYLNPQRMGGAETYVRSLIRELQNIDADERFVIFAPRGHDLEIRNSNFEVVECDVDPSRVFGRIYWEQTKLCDVMKKCDLDLAHFPYSSLPLRYRGKAVVTIHDVKRFQCPQLVPRLERIYKAIMERNVAAKNRHVILVSNTDIPFIVDNDGIARERIFVTYHGIEPLFLADDDPASQREYLLWVGRPYASKNLSVLFGALRLLAESGYSVPTLRLIGASGHERQFASDVKGMEKNVSFEAPVENQMLPPIYRGANVFCFPSFAESFGIPPIEAMGCGAAVICSDIPVLREVCGDAAVFCDPDDPQAFADAIRKVLDDAAYRGELTSRAKERAAGFTWPKCAQDTLGIYRRILQQS